MNIQHIVDQYHRAADEFSRGNPLPVKMMFSHQDDVILANPFGPPVLGWSKVSESLDFASSRFKDGQVTSFETIAKWKAKVSGREQVSSFDLRVTSTFRSEDGGWKLIHRHADPITTFHPDGP